MTEFFRFPHTPHLAWLGRARPREDKVLDAYEVEALLSGEVVVEEKVDGANVGFSTSEEGVVRVQNRGKYLSPDVAHPQFKPLFGWLASRRDALAAALHPGLMLFGEWCYATHSVRYDRLPDWFLGFDVYDRERRVFWSSSARDALLAGLGLASVPHLARGRFALEALEALMGTSGVGSAPMEGLVVRREREGETVARAKLVRASFTQSIDEHWSRGPLEKNALAPGASPWS
jgi:ATP-dependent RNA circularization protein (DNA/RNA ligase family)